VVPVVPAVPVAGVIVLALGELVVVLAGVVVVPEVAVLDVVVLSDDAEGLSVPQAVTSTARPASAAPAFVRRPICCAEATAFPLCRRLHEPCVTGMTLEGWRWLGTLRKIVSR
jgi:hypothetical protein